MQIIERGGIVKLHAEDWINKTLGVRKVDLIVDDGEGEKTYSYPYLFPFAPGIKVFRRLFPWADFFADEEYYNDADYNQWRLSDNCYYDSEEDRWITIGDSFAEFRELLDPVRGIDHMVKLLNLCLLCD